MRSMLLPVVSIVNSGRHRRAWHVPRTGRQGTHEGESESPWKGQIERERERDARIPLKRVLGK